MKTEKEIKDKIKRYLEISFHQPSESLAQDFQKRAEALSWVLDWKDQQFYDFWDKVLENWQKEHPAD